MHRRCNYNRDVITEAKKAIEIELNKRNLGLSKQLFEGIPDKIQYYKDQYERSSHISAVLLPHLTAQTVPFLSDRHLQGLLQIATQMLGHKPFHLVTVHDESTLGSALQ